MNEKKIQHGIDCPCEECAKIRDLLFRGELEGKLHLVGLQKDLKKLRK